jgi:hypothetical protein
VTTADVTGATNIYFAPYTGNRIALYDGSSDWNIRTFTVITIAVGTIDAGKPYDLFAYDNSGTVTFDAPLAWTNDTSRATALTTQDGVLVKTGATTRRYIGTFYTTATTTTEDSFAKRFVWNYYHRVRKPMRVLDATNSWTYTTATWRQSNGSTANQLDFVVGVAECAVSVNVTALSSNSSDVGRAAGIGLDSTSSPTALVTNNSVYHSSVTVNTWAQHSVWGRFYPSEGRHFYAWLEYSNATGTCTWIGDSGVATFIQTGIQGEIEG